MKNKNHTAYCNKNKICNIGSTQTVKTGLMGRVKDCSFSFKNLIKSHLLEILQGQLTSNYFLHQTIIWSFGKFKKKFTISAWRLCQCLLSDKYHKSHTNYYFWVPQLYTNTYIMQLMHSTERSDENYKWGKSNSTVFKASGCNAAEDLSFLFFTHEGLHLLFLRLLYKEMKKALIFTHNQRRTEEETWKERERKRRIGSWLRRRIKETFLKVEEHVCIFLLNLKKYFY